MSPDPRRLPIPGVNLWGYLCTESGVGEHARTLLAALDEARVPTVPIDFADTRSRRDHPLPLGAREEPVFDLHLICVNADQTPHFVARVGAERLAGRRIGYWHWEVEEFPDRMAESAALVDEIWTASRHSAAAIGRKVAKPIHVVPPAVAPPPPAPPPADLLPPGEGPLFLSCFDFDSVIERKNPQGAIEAFRRAFPAGGARLLIKSVNGHLHPERLAALTELAAVERGVRLVDRYVSRAEQAGLIAACDVFVSLHRAEGFGLMLAEAMWFGKPVVATAYSGNLEFMDESTGRLIPWRSAPVAPGAGPYRGTWAEPDLDAAAAAMRELAESPAVARALGEQSRAAVVARHSVAARSAGLIEGLRAGAGGGSAAVDFEGERSWIEGQILQGADPGSGSRFGALARRLRRWMLRAIRLQTLHQRAIDLALLRHLGSRLEALEARARAETAQRHLLEGELRRLARAALRLEAGS